MMNEDVFNREVRKFLRQVGVTSQREIERAVRAYQPWPRVTTERDGDRLTILPAMAGGAPDG